MKMVPRIKTENEESEKDQKTKFRNKIRNKTEKEESAIAKRVNKNLVFNVNSSNTDRRVNPTVDNNKSLRLDSHV